MSSDPRHILEQRWEEVAEELRRITSNRLIPDQAVPEDREAELLAEQDEIEWKLGTLDEISRHSDSANS